MLERVLETEVMDTPEEALDYDSMDHSQVNQVFAEAFLELLDSKGAPPARPPRVLDVGTGTARIPIHICRLRPAFEITAVDLAEHMLNLGRKNVADAGFQHLIRLEKVDAKGLPYADGAFDAVISNSIIHHIPKPVGCLREMARVLRPGGALFVRDLLRLPSDDQILEILAKHAGGATAHQRQMFEDSLRAALTVAEVQELLEQVGLPGDMVRQSSDRHWTICGWKA
ncbi:MAG: class I SAM-dependent methyltransferase [Planctomycetaceae bacterium]|nr:MAG: class I SAM-dependent methyltransferase [Planctomycetaceae bacterium]